MDSSQGSDSSFFSLTNEGAGFSEQIRLEKEGRTQVYYKVCIDGRYYFMKALRPEYLHKEFYREMMRKEYELGSQLNSDYVVHYTRLAESPDECYLLMEYINGKNLAEFLKDNPLYFRREAHLNRFLRQLCLALQEMHQHQALHLDLKPSNILLTATNSDVRLIDLGCSYTDSRTLTIGLTDRYAAPEQLGDGSDVDARTDIYAIGRVLQFIGEDHLPRRYRKIVHRCLQEDKEKRFQTVEEVLAAITPPTRQSWLLLPVMLLLVLAGLYAGGMFRADGEFLPQDSIILDRSTGDTLYVRVLSVEERRAAIVQAPPGGHVYTGDIVIPESIRYKRHTFRITEIGEKAFAECTDIKSMHLPSTLGIIHEGAFYGCTDMKTINLPSSLRTVMPDAFVTCISLQRALAGGHQRGDPQQFRGLPLAARSHPARGHHRHPAGCLLRLRCADHHQPALHADPPRPWCLLFLRRTAQHHHPRACHLPGSLPLLQMLIAGDHLHATAHAARHLQYHGPTVHCQSLCSRCRIQSLLQSTGMERSDIKPGSVNSVMRRTD